MLVGQLHAMWSSDGAGCLEQRWGLTMVCFTGNLAAAAARAALFASTRLSSSRLHRTKHAYDTLMLPIS